MKIACFVAMAFVLGAVASPSAANAKAIAMAAVPMQKVRNRFEAKEKAGKLSPEERKLFALVKVSQDVVGVSSLSVPERNVEALSLQKENFVSAVHLAIQKDPRWEKQVAPDAVAKIRAESAVLEESFGARSYAWAWFQYQAGEKKRAKEILTSLYAEEYDNVMKLERAVYGFHGTPLGWAEAQFQALEPMCEGAEKEAVKDRMQKMKVRVSNLPQSHIVT